jgi:hypothetical protein
MTAPGQPAPARGRALSRAAAGMARTALQRPEQQAVAEHKAATASSPLVPAQ